MVFFAPPAPSVRARTRLPGLGRAGLVQCPADDLDVVGARAASRRFRGAARVPRASSPALPVPWSNHAVRGAVTEPLLERVGAAPSISPNGRRVDAHQSGVDVDHRRPVRPDTGPPRRQRPVSARRPGPRPLSRCLAGPASTASAASTWSARVPTSRETVGSEATDPRISFSRRGERSDRQRPPRVARTAGSAMTLPGSRTDHGRRHADRAPQSSLPSPAPGRLRSAASPRPAPPQQHPRTPHPPTECNSLIFHHEDALPLKLSDLSNPHHPKRNDTPPRLQHPNNENSRLGSRAGCRAPRDRGR